MVETPCRNTGGGFLFVDVRNPMYILKMRKVYLDHTATTPLNPEVLEAMMPYFSEKFGNASSIHRFGQESKAALDECRNTIAKILGAHQGELFFVSGGTEADNALIKGAAWNMRDVSGKD